MLEWCLVTKGPPSSTSFTLHNKIKIERECPIDIYHIICLTSGNDCNIDSSHNHNHPKLHGHYIFQVCIVVGLIGDGKDDDSLLYV